MTGTPLVAVFPEVVGIAAELLRRREVAQRWTAESACPGMTVGGLAHHLAGQAGHAVALLSAPAHPVELVGVLDHYRRAAWVQEGLEGGANVEIRAAADSQAAGGPQALHARLAADLAALPMVIEPVLRGRRVPDAVHIPWQGWALTAGDFLLTRTMEVLVHSDDLAASVGVPAPTYPHEAAEPVLALLAALAARRHGQTALLRALARPQRASGEVSAF
ncbi:maleylpyruvate isomerase N-terminal domain-containing protein [Phycicoccus endophyticus]|uniref:Maleylpyruvate isomerase N-terminal domain-containing protein n=1 Tax=Phycicoccus endophyticus TaxID=1690220 RepID=A0A7G9R3W7_9MICO|nr:maleylpyruvate isomerase N-terminal domain-containing protein [Phycicoccus endophyticus]NHI18125.1 hypothetical protein [Phycicoccus endophyticus]QNN50292.1 maleylpyruvate isomerase N-terminal domain-containing protein [Phycicoccus endophyticus]GGL26230.1 hypothetical protein GCM10012283_05540 [Phycicoccus endophyticus]